MKKIILFIFILILAGCDNPFKKYEDSFDLLQANLDAAKRVDTAVNTITQITSYFGNFRL